MIMLEKEEPFKEIISTLSDTMNDKVCRESVIGKHVKSDGADEKHGLCCNVSAKRQC